MRGRRRLTPAQRVEIAAIDKLTRGKVRTLPWHLIFAHQLRAGTASQQIVAAAERSKREWTDLNNQQGGRE